MKIYWVFIIIITMLYGGSPKTFAATGENLTSLASELIKSEKDILPFTETLALNNQAGTMMMWVKLNPSTNSRVLVSARWDEQEALSYLVISDGWWEQLDKHGFYFVLDNRQSAFCFIDDYSIPDGVWTLVTVAWGKKDEDSHYCHIYINGDFYVEKAINVRAEKNAKQVNRYDDKLTDNPQQRTPKGKTGGWLYKPYALSAADISSLYALTKSGYAETSPPNPPVTARTSIAGSRDSGKLFPKFKNRVLFDEDIYWALSKQNTDNIIQFLKENDFNVYVPCVWHGGGAYYKNTLNLYDQRVKLRVVQNDDPLAYLLQQAKLNKITIYPWYTITYREQNFLPSFALPQDEGIFNIHNKDFRELITTLINEAIQNYQLEGINLDYIRSIDICVTEACQADFKNQFGKTLPLDAFSLNENNDVYKAVAAWNAKAVEDIIKKITVDLGEGKKAVISVDAVPYNKDILLQGQDSIRWLNEGLIDIAYIMKYQRHLSRTDLKRAAADKKAGSVIPLIATYDHILGQLNYRPASALNEQLNVVANEMGYDGIAIYHRKTLSSEQLHYLRGTENKQ